MSAETLKLMKSMKTIPLPDRFVDCKSRWQKARWLAKHAVDSEFKIDPDTFRALIAFKMPPNLFAQACKQVMIGKNPGAKLRVLELWAEIQGVSGVQKAKGRQVAEGNKAGMRDLGSVMAEVLGKPREGGNNNVGNNDRGEQSASAAEEPPEDVPAGPEDAGTVESPGQ